MPKGSEYPGPAEQLERYAAGVGRAASGAEVKGAKNPYTSRNGHMTSFLGPDGTAALHLSDELTEEFRATYESGDVKSHGATMRGYSSVPDDLLGDPEEFAHWFDRSWEWIGTLPAKATKAKKAK